MPEPSLSVDVSPKEIPESRRVPENMMLELLLSGLVSCAESKEGRTQKGRL